MTRFVCPLIVAGASIAVSQIWGWYIWLAFMSGFFFCLLVIFWPPTVTNRRARDL